MPSLWFTKYLMLGLQKWDRLLHSQDARKHASVNARGLQWTGTLQWNGTLEHGASSFCVNTENILEEESWTIELECEHNIPCAFYKHGMVWTNSKSRLTPAWYIYSRCRKEKVLKVSRENNSITAHTDFVGNHTRKQCMNRLCFKVCEKKPIIVHGEIRAIQLSMASLYAFQKQHLLLPQCWK